VQHMKDLFESIAAGRADAVREAVAAAPALVHDTDENGKTLLHSAAEHDNVDLVVHLLSQGAQLEAETHWGMTPLEWAANNGSARVVDLLLSRGARMNMRSAAAVGKLDTVQTFWIGPREVRPEAAQKGYMQQEDGTYVPTPPPDDYDTIVSDAFYVAARNGQTHVARWLLERGANVHHKGTLGGTPLHWAAGNGHRETVAFLLEHGAESDKHVQDDEFEATPAGWARHFGRTEILDLLAEDATPSAPCHSPSR